ncbi:MAG TPA: tRNA lysidine(34) synthetase TilS [Pirellulales bacterium]|nr:tRNA lysidine(34) synthetase TilS [Pirellulales bacterium]
MSPFLERVVEVWPVGGWAGRTVLLAVSGGADSVALLRTVAAIRPSDAAGRLVIGHFHHGLRGEAADADAKFVAALAERLGIECRVGHADVAALAAQQGDGLEAAARAGRYEFFRDAAESIGARYVVTAHTADDQAETILHRIVRGTGLRGLRGMARARALGPAVSLLRPLLEFRRAELREYLEAIGQAFREDTSNADRRYTRNRLRHDLLPLLAEQFNANVVEALARLGQIACQAQAVVEPLAEAAVGTSVRDDGACVIVDCEILAGCPPYVVREALTSIWRRQGWPVQAMGQREWDLVAELIVRGAEDARHVLPGGVHVSRARRLLRLERGPATAERHSGKNS